MKKVISVVLAVLFLVTGLAFAGSKAKIAVAANDKVPAAAISNAAGMANFFLFFDGKGKLTEALENPFKGKEGAGKSVADLLARKGVTIIVAGSFGGPIVDVMKGKGIKAVTFKGSAEEAVRKVLQPK